jgi:hypothetical protein
VVGNRVLSPVLRNFLLKLEPKARGTEAPRSHMKNPPGLSPGGSCQVRFQKGSRCSIAMP